MNEWRSCCGAIYVNEKFMLLVDGRFGFDSLLSNKILDPAMKKGTPIPDRKETRYSCKVCDII